jgi:hypothetical protein
VSDTEMRRNRKPPRARCSSSRPPDEPALVSLSGPLKGTAGKVGYRKRLSRADTVST